MDNQNNRYYIKKYLLTVKTGLHIGAGKDSFEIGEMDNPVVKEFDTGIPYIPGSSLKGKIRSLLENVYKNDDDKKKLIDNLFGKPAQDKNNANEYTILLIRDGFVTKDLRIKLNEKINSGEKITEEKTEVALRGGKQANPRPIERVPVNYKFEIEVVFRFLDEEDFDKREEYTKLWEEGIQLLQKDYLGGSGSRGYGKVEIKELEVKNN